MEDRSTLLADSIEIDKRSDIWRSEDDLSDPTDLTAFEKRPAGPKK